MIPWENTKKLLLLLVISISQFVHRTLSVSTGQRTIPPSACARGRGIISLVPPISRALHSLVTFPSTTRHYARRNGDIRPAPSDGRRV